MAKCAKWFGKNRSNLDGNRAEISGRKTYQKNEAVGLSNILEGDSRGKSRWRDLIEKLLERRL